VSARERVLVPAIRAALAFSPAIECQLGYHRRMPLACRRHCSNNLAFLLPFLIVLNSAAASKKIESADHLPPVYARKHDRISGDLNDISNQACKLCNPGQRIDVDIRKRSRMDFDP